MSCSPVSLAVGELVAPRVRWGARTDAPQQQTSRLHSTRIRAPG